MRLFNTAKREVEEFKPLNADEVKVYTCGPTVYNFQHIGNYAAQIYWDLLVRTLTANGYKVKRVLNMTDVGHLVSDGDEGEDKLEKGARREGKSAWEVAQYYIDDFLENFKLLRLAAPAKIARATDYIEADKALVQRLIDGGYTYETADGIYFDTARFPAYADFARLDLANLKAGARVDFSEEKRNPSDFAVWKFIKEGEKHEMRWDFLGRPGYPGWHLECSTIIHEELGEPIDIHCGGIDHIPVHHTNEIAQSEAAFGKKLAEFWLHCDFLQVDGQKISKSLGNVYLISDLVERGFSPMDYKLWVLQGHYQSARNFDFKGLMGARARRLRYRNQIALCYQHGTGPAASEKTAGGLSPSSRLEHSSLGRSGALAQVLGPTKECSAPTFAAEHPTGATPADYDSILAAVSDNLNSPKALAILDGVEGVGMEFWQKIDELFGLGLVEDSPDISDEVRELLDKRAAAREKKDFALSDKLRDELTNKHGIQPKDTAAGQIWQYAA